MLEDIRAFVEVVKLGSFTRAAEAMSVSRSVLSKKITALERSLNVRLLNRTTRKLSLTEAGERLYERCHESLNHIDEAVSEVTSLNLEPRGRLQVNLPMSFGIVHVAPFIAAFRARYPLIDVVLNFEDLKVDVIEPGFDVSIRIAKLTDSSLIAKPICVCHHRIVAAPTYLAQFGAPTTPEALANGHTIASFRLQDSALQWELDHPSGHQSVHLKANIEANNSLALREIVLAGAAIARMPTFLVGPDIAAGGLVALLPEFTCPSQTIYWVYPRREYLASKTRVFMAFMEERIKRAEWDTGL